MKKFAFIGLVLLAGGACALAAEPMSNQASNIVSGSPEMAKQLPSPDAASHTVPALLDAATTALNANQTGRAQEALEEAETRALDRSVVATAAGEPISGPVVNNISMARQALGMNNIPAALSDIAAAKAAFTSRDHT